MTNVPAARRVAAVSLLLPAAIVGSTLSRGRRWSVGSDGLKPRMKLGSAWHLAQNSGIQVRSTWRTSALGHRAAMSGVITSFSGEPPWQPEQESPRRKCTSLTKLLRFSRSED